MAYPDEEIVASDGAALPDEEAASAVGDPDVLPFLLEGKSPKEYLDARREVLKSMPLSEVVEMHVRAIMDGIAAEGALLNRVEQMGTRSCRTVCQ